MVKKVTLRNHFNTNRAWQGSQALKMTGFNEIDNGSQRFQVKMYVFVFCF